MNLTNSFMYCGKKPFWFCNSQQKDEFVYNNCLNITRLTGDGYSLRFKNEYDLYFRFYNDMYWYDIDDLRLYGVAKDLKTLKAEFEENVIVCWQMYVECDEIELTNDAIELRKKLINLLIKE